MGRWELYTNETSLWLTLLSRYIFATTAARKMLPSFAGCCSLAVYWSIKIPGSFLALPNLFALFMQLSFWKMVQSGEEQIFLLSLQVKVEPWLKRGFYFWWALIDWHWVGVLQPLWQRRWVLNKYPLCFSDKYNGGLLFDFLRQAIFTSFLSNYLYSLWTLSQTC